MVEHREKILGIVHAIEELPEVLRAMQAAGGEQLLVVGDRRIAAAATAAQCPIRVLDYYASSEDMQKKAVSWIDEWSDSVISGGLSLKEALGYKNFSLWWFFLPVIFPDAMRCLQYVELYKAVFAAEQPSSVICADVSVRPMLPYRLNRAFDLPLRVGIQVAKAMEVPVSTFEVSWRGTWNFWTIYWRRTVSAALYRAFGRRLDGWGRRTIAAIARLAGGRRTSSNHRTLAVFSTPVYWRQEGDWADAPGGRDLIVGRAVDRLAETGAWEIVDIDTEVNVPSLTHYRRFWHKARRAKVRCRPLESYCDRSLRRTVAASRSLLVANWAEWKRDPGFRDSLSYRGVALWPLLCHRLDFLFGEYASVALEHIEAAERVLETERPDAVLMEYEEGSYGRAATVAAAARGVPTIALQHGLHGGPYIPSHYFRAIRWEGVGEQVSCPVPTRTAVFGESTRRYLTEMSAYPAAAVAVTGTTIYDDALAFPAGIVQPALARELGLDVNTRIATVLGSIFTEAQDRRSFIENALGGIADIGMQCVVKLHPHEDEGTWLDIAMGLGLSPPLLLHEGLWRAIGAADAVVSWYSTTILDALLLRRPVVVLRIQGKNNPDNFAGGVEIVDGRLELAAALGWLGVDSPQRNERIEQGLAVLGEHLYQCDGKADRRIANLVEDVAVVGNPKIVADEDLVHGV